MRYSKRKIQIIATLLALIFVGLSQVIKPKTNSPLNGALLVHYIDIGQGDSELIMLPNGKTILIDAGENVSEERLLRFLKQQQITTIDYLIGTHPHSDHIGGMAEVLDEFSVGAVYLPKVSHTTKTFEDLLLGIAENDLQVHTAKAGVVMLDEGDLKAEFLAPNSASYEELNDYSAVLKLTYKDASFLFTGDAEKLSENEMQSLGQDIRADILKVAHHGSSTSSGLNFLRECQPQYAIISCAKGNDYGHPHRETIASLEKVGAKVFRTDELGTITVESDGENYKITHER